MTPTLSVIVPVYKVEKYIRKCISSILSQSIDASWYELIIVNDGTPDASIESVADLISANNVKLIVQENQGLSCSRNNGLKQARGKYVWFVDSDDWLLSNAFEDVSFAINNNPDVDVFSTVLKDYIEDNGMTYVEYKPKERHLSGKQYIKNRYKQGASQRFIFKKSFLLENNLSFYPGILHEDGLFGYKMLYYAKNILILEKPVYAYRKHSGSIMTSISMKTPRDLLFIHKELVKFCNENVNPVDKIWYRHEIFKILLDLLQFSQNLSLNKEFIEFYNTNKAYFIYEANIMIKDQFMSIQAYRMKYIQLSYMKFKQLLKNLLCR